MSSDSDPTEQVAEAIRDRIAQHGYAMSLDTARDLAQAAIDALTNDGWALTSIPKDSTGRDLEMLWRIKPQEDARG